VQVLKAEYKRGVDVVYEAVGGDMFKVAVDALATQGRVLVIGMMSQYGDGWPTAQHPGLPEKLLKKSATLQGARPPHVLLGAWESGSRSLHCHSVPALKACGPRRTVVVDLLVRCALDARSRVWHQQSCRICWQSCAPHSMLPPRVASPQWLLAHCLTAEIPLCRLLSAALRQQAAAAPPEALCAAR